MILKYKVAIYLLFGSFCINFFACANGHKVAIIGAGTSGLAAAERASENGFKVTIYEQNNVVGGLWWYTDDVGKNKYGLDIHTAMYDVLSTNLPYQVMAFPDLPFNIADKRKSSYLSHNDIYKYLNSYADKFHLKKLVKFEHLVKLVQPLSDGKWNVTVRDLPNNKEESNTFDFVVVCSGHSFSPYIPIFDGINEFSEVASNQVLHSHDYRKAKAFQGKDVLIIGGGRSGMDLVAQVSETAKSLTFSTRRGPIESIMTFDRRKNSLSRNVDIKGEVKRFSKTGAEFDDGSSKTFSVVLFATGYDYKFSFLSKECGITIDDNYVSPLYKQIINIEHTTMAFIGVIHGVASAPAFDIQARFVMEFWSNVEKKLPSKDDMTKDMEKRMAEHWKRFNKRNSHFVGLAQPLYFQDLSETANIPNVPDIIYNLFENSTIELVKDPATFRQYRYTVNGNDFKRDRAVL